jgi:plasmid stabilization system protein ParE
MTRRVIKSDLVLKDLEEQAEYIRLRSPQAALRFLDAVEALFRQLASMPGIGERFETANPLFRRSSLLSDPEVPLADRGLQATEGRDRRDPGPAWRPGR